MKLPAYAAGGVAELWLVEPTTGRLSRFREPDGERYRNETVLVWPDGLDQLVADLVTRLSG